jgi:hypothetical protein
VKENTERELAYISRQYYQAARNNFRRFLDYPQKQEFSNLRFVYHQLSSNVMESCRNICDSHGAKRHDTIK